MSFDALRGGRARTIFANQGPETDRAILGADPREVTSNEDVANLFLAHGKSSLLL
jgi:hypothetical protein